MPLLTNDIWRTELSRCIDQANQTHQFELAAFVYMPEHLHLLVFPLTAQPNIGTYLAAIKQPLSSFAHNCLEESGSPLLASWTFASDLENSASDSGRKEQASIATYSQLKLFKGR